MTSIGPWKRSDLQQRAQSGMGWGSARRIPKQHNPRCIWTANGKVTFKPAGTVNFSTKYEYADGKLTGQETTKPDSTVISTSKYEYDENGEIVKSKETYYDDDGNLKFESEH